MKNGSVQKHQICVQLLDCNCPQIIAIIKWKWHNSLQKFMKLAVYLFRISRKPLLYIEVSRNKMWATVSTLNLPSLVFSEQWNFVLYNSNDLNIYISCCLQSLLFSILHCMIDRLSSPNTAKLSTS